VQSGMELLVVESHDHGDEDFGTNRALSPGHGDDVAGPRPE
jgi:hypothetical protein